MQKMVDCMKGVVNQWVQIRGEKCLDRSILLLPCQPFFYSILSFVVFLKLLFIQTCFINSKNYLFRGLFANIQSDFLLKTDFGVRVI